MSGIADDAGAIQRAARIHGRQDRLGDVAIDAQDAAIHRRRAGVSVRAGEDQRSAADLFQRADPAGPQPQGLKSPMTPLTSVGQIVAADDERVAAADVIEAAAFDRSGGDAAVAGRAEAAAEIDDAGAGGDEARGAAGGVVEERGLAAVLGDDRGITGRRERTEIGDTVGLVDDRCIGRGRSAFRARHRTSCRRNPC